MQLTKLLMDGQLDAFARMLQRNYDVSRLLPKHYREALVLYNHVSQQPLIVFRSNLNDTYADFLKLKKAADQSPAASVSLKQHYGNTYWLLLFPYPNHLKILYCRHPLKLVIRCICALIRILLRGLFVDDGAVNGFGFAW